MRDADKPGLAVGFFDGVHLGHQAILAGAEVAFTFKNHPLSVLAPGKMPPLVTCWSHREAAIRACGVREVVGLDFTRDLAALSPLEFVDLHLARFAGWRIFAGGDWRFGRDGAGGLDTLAELGFEVHEVPYALYKGGRISSTRIRQALAGGDLESAAAMLGRAWRLEGVQIPGKGEGAKLGFPTINILPNPALVHLPNGVYECRFDGRKAIANYGIAPTFGDRAWPQPVCEVHLPEDCPPVESDVEMVRFIRPERKFDSVDALKAQIRKDIDGIL